MLKKQGIADESFDIDPASVPRPKWRRMVLAEGTQIIYEEGNEPKQRPRDDGRIEVVVVTTKITKDDVDSEKNSKSS